jgi:hypothetical protein
MLDVSMGHVGAVSWRRTVTVFLVVAGALLLGNAAVGRAADYQDANDNVCGGPNCFNGSAFGNGAEFNIASGANMINSLSTGSSTTPQPG